MNPIVLIVIPSGTGEMAARWSHKWQLELSNALHLADFGIDL